MSYFENKVILITGAASGIGRQLAKLLSKEGATIAGLDLQEEGLKSLEAELDKPYAWEQGDVTNIETQRKADRNLEQKLGPTDMLIACAGVGIETPAFSFRAEDMEKVIRLNLLGVINSFESVLAGMLERRSGHLVGFSSMASYRGLPRMAGYCASKAGLNAVLESLRVELQNQNIIVTTVCPSWIRTPMTADVRVPPKDLMELEDACELILFAIRKKKSFYAFPKSAVRVMSFLNMLPRSIGDKLITRRLRKISKTKSTQPES